MQKFKFKNNNEDFLRLKQFKLEMEMLYK